MNIFKILANGHGTVNENNVSAFLGYLLDPNANHGLGYEFLSHFIAELDLEDDFNPKKYDFQIFFEQEFKRQNTIKKEVVDICLLCYETETKGKSKSKMLDFIKNTKKLKKVFLIENKIKTSSITENQVLNQFLACKEELENEINALEDIYSIYITPTGEKFDKEFLKIPSDVPNKKHINWNSDSDNEQSIKKLLKELLLSESRLDAEPINEFSKLTIKAFIQFIESGFKSEKEEKKDRKNDGSYTNRFIALNEKYNIEYKLNELRNNLLSLNPKLEIYKPDLSRPRTPQLRIPYKGLFIELYGGFTSRNIIKLIYRLDKNNPESINQLKLFCLKSGIELKSKNSKLAYCNINTENYPKFTINDYENIYEGIKKAINLLDKYLH